MGVLIQSSGFRGRLHETRDPEQFRRAMDGAPPGAPCEVVIQVSDDERRWADAEIFWSGPYRDDMPIPLGPDVVAAGVQSGARYARYVVRSTI